MKKLYVTPTMTVVSIQQQNSILQTSQVTDVSGNGGFTPGGGGHGPNRARSNDGWDDWSDE